MLGSTNPSASYETPLKFYCFETFQLVCGLNNEFYSSAVSRVRSTISSVTQQFDKETLKCRSTSFSTACRDINSSAGSESQLFPDLFDGWTNGRTPVWIKEYIAFSPSRIALSEHRQSKARRRGYSVLCSSTEVFHLTARPLRVVPNGSSQVVFSYRCHHTTLFSHWYPSSHPFSLISG